MAKYYTHSHDFDYVAADEVESDASLDLGAIDDVAHHSKHGEEKGHQHHAEEDDTECVLVLLHLVLERKNLKHNNLFKGDTFKYFDF